MKQYLPFLNLVCSLFCLPAARAAVSIDFYGVGELDGSRNLILSSGADVPNGNEVRLGFFVLGFDVAANSRNLIALGNAWHTFGSTITMAYFPMPDNSISGCYSYRDNPRPNTIESESIFYNQKIYLWAFKTAGNIAPSADYSNVEEYGIFSSINTTDLDSTWVFPEANASLTGDIRYLGAQQVDQFFAGKLRGSSLQLTSVPEPAVTGMVFGLSASLLGLMVLRKNQ